MKIRKNLYYKKIFTVLLLIGVIPVLILMFSVSSMTSAQTEILYEVQISSIINKRKQIEVSLEYVDNSMIRAGLSGTMTSGVRKTREAKHFQDFNAINAQLTLLGSLAFPISDTILVSNQKNWVMTPNSFLPIEESPYSSLIEQLNRIEQTSFWHYDEDYIYLAERIPVNAEKGNGMLISKIDKATIRTELSGNDENVRVVILDEKGQCLVGRTEDAAIVEYIKAAPQKWEALQAGQAQQTTFHKENYVCAISRSEFNDWTYVSVVSNSEMTKGVKSVYRTMWIVIVSVILVILTLVIRFSKMLYHPIGVLNELVDNSLSDSEDGPVQEDESITTKVNYLVEKNVELKKKLSDKETFEREIYLKKIYRNELTEVTTEELIRHKVILEPIDGKHIHVMAIKYYHDLDSLNDKKNFLSGLKNIVSELIGTEDAFIPVDIEQVIYITHYKAYMSAEGAMMQLQRTCEMVISAIAQYVGVKVNIGVSSQFFEVSKLPDAVEECNCALRKAMGRFGVSIFYGVNDEKRVVLSEIKIKQNRLQIMQSVLEGNEQQCMAHLNGYFEKLDGLDYYLFKLEVNKLLSDILDCYNEYSIQPEYSKIKEITDFDITQNVDSIEKLKTHLWDYFLYPLNQRVKEPVENQKVISLISEYLLEHIEQDVSLEQCAQHFNYNPNYLSRMFKKQFGKTYTEYIIDKKLERCKRLLEETDISINEISVRLGYNSPQNFIRVFKKYTLMTPGEYRNQNKKKS